MRTTLDMDDSLIKEAKKRAAGQGATLTRLLEEALREYLRPKTAVRKGFRLNLVTRKGEARRGVDPSDRDTLYDLMEKDG